MSSINYRRCFGIIYGALLGLLFTGTFQGINHLVLPGVPLYQPPFGMALNILTGALVGLATVGLDAWPESPFRGVLFSSLLGSLLVGVATLLTGQTGAGVWAKKITATLIIFVPIAALLALPLLFLRWMMDREENDYRETGSHFLSRPGPGAFLPVGVLLIAGGMGFFGLYHPMARTVLPRMHTLIQFGQAAAAPALLPMELRPPNVTGFVDYGSGAYELEWDKDETNRFQIPRPNTPFSEQSIVIAHFSNDYLLVCMFPGGSGQVECRDFPPGQSTN